MPKWFDKLKIPLWIAFIGVFWAGSIWIIYANYGHGFIQYVTMVMAGYSSIFLASLAVALIYVFTDWAVGLGKAWKEG